MHVFRHNAIDSVNITFICKGKPKFMQLTLLHLVQGSEPTVSLVCLHVMNKYLSFDEY